MRQVRKTPRLKLFVLPIAVLFLCIVFKSVAVLAADSAENPPKPSLQAFLDKKSAFVGETVRLTLQYHLPGNATLPEKPEIGEIEALTETGRVIEDHRITLTFLVDRLESWTSGPITLVYRDEKNEKQMLTADPVSLAVNSNVGEEAKDADLRPIMDIIPVSHSWRKYLLWAVFLGAFLCMIAGLIRWYRKRQPADIQPEVLDPPDVVARREISQLEARQLFETGKVKEYYFLLSEIIRKYMASIRGFPASEYTTEEIAYHIRNNEKDREILPLLRQTDLVKFADMMPTRQRKDEDVQKVLLYIQDTGSVAERVDKDSLIAEKRP